MTTLDTFEEDDADVSVKSPFDHDVLAREMWSYSVWTHHPDPLTILLIHGFRTDEKKASKNYNTFKRKLAEIDTRLADCTRTFSWPSRSSILDGTQFFLAKDEVAREAGRMLGDGILLDMALPRARPRDYVLVAHSLGSRVVMEALARILDQRPDAGRQFRVLLMAAALPVEDFGTETDITPYAHIVKSIASVDVLHSTNDRALGIVFRTGYLGATSGAVGREGKPDHVWDHSAEFTPYRHRHYWADVNNKATNHLGDLLGFEVIRTMDEGVMDNGDVLDAGVI
ncbi:MAG: alpha/beta hydrolase [Pseudomonadota bacterium]